MVIWVPTLSADDFGKLLRHMHRMTQVHIWAHLLTAEPRSSPKRKSQGYAVADLALGLSPTEMHFWMSLSHTPDSR
jgi:hypothetical protein